MSVSFIYQNLQFHYRIDSHSSSLPFIAWGCRELPIHGEAHSKEHMYEQIKQRLKQYYRNRVPVPVQKCTECGISLQGREREGKTCDEHDYDR
jgi:hypothetical protein